MASAAAVTSTDAAAAGTPAKTYAAPRLTPGMLLNLIAIADEDRHEFLVPDAYPFNIRYVEVGGVPRVHHRVRGTHASTMHTAHHTACTVTTVRSLNSSGGPKVIAYAGNRLTYDGQGRLATVGAIRVTRDAAGVVTEVGGRSHTYDEEGRLNQPDQDRSPTGSRYDVTLQ